MNTPDNLRYSSEHEWVKSEDGSKVRIGITDYAQDALGDIVYIDLPQIGQAVESGQQIGEVESTKSISDLYAPVSGEVLEINDELEEHPERLNADPYGEGWICVVELSSEAKLDDLLDAAAYIQLTEA